MIKLKDGKVDRSGWYPREQAAEVAETEPPYFRAMIGAVHELADALDAATLDTKRLDAIEQAFRASDQLGTVLNINAAGEKCEFNLRHWIDTGRTNVFGVPVAALSSAPPGESK